MSNLFILSLFLIHFSCSNKLASSLGREPLNGAPGNSTPGESDSFGPPNPPTTTTTTTLPSGGGAGGGNPTGESGYGKGAGCTGQAGDVCLGGYDNDTDAKPLKVNVVYAAPAGTSLTNNAQAHAETFINRLNGYYVHNGHRYMNLELNDVMEVPQESDQALIQKYAKPGYYTMLLVQSIPGSTVGYVQHMCAELDKTQGWTVFEFSFVARGVVEHEANHSFCFPHTSSQNGGNPSVFLPGYNEMADILRPIGGLKKSFNPSFKNYVDRQNRSNAQVPQDGMIYDTHNLMYYSVLQDRPGLFTNGSTGYHHSYSHLFDYYYWNFIKPGAL